MSRRSVGAMEDLWHRHNAAWRDTAQIASQWQDAQDLDPSLFEYKVKGAFWETLHSLGITLIVAREYEHLVMAMHMKGKRPVMSFMPMPHPSGIVVDRARNSVHIASTRNPNQIYDLLPTSSTLDRSDMTIDPLEDRPLVPVRSRFLPGSLYIHDLALIGGALYANAVGHNAVVKLDGDGQFERSWWPKCIEASRRNHFDANYIQLNSIAAGADLKSSYFSASSSQVSSRRPGHKNYPVDRRGVLFSGKTREPIVTGLTRPHSARFREKDRHQAVWIDNSGYGEFGRCSLSEGRFEVFTRLPGWTRGLAFCGNVAFVGTSRVIPKFSQYAPGLDVDRSTCAVHAIDMRSGKILGSLSWPRGNQIFAIDWIASNRSGGFAFPAGRTNHDARPLFYSFQTGGKS